MRRPLLFALLILGLADCSSSPIVDTSMDAFAAGDYTLPGSACEAVPGGGVDACRVTAGAMISSGWIMVVPKPNKASGVTSGTIDVYFKDIHKTYTVKDWTVEVSWADFFGKGSWDSSMDGEAMALLSLNWTDGQGIHQVTEARGLAVLIVTKDGYSRLSVDSGTAAWGTDCKVQMSTAGRSAIECR